MVCARCSAFQFFVQFTRSVTIGRTITELRHLDIAGNIKDILVQKMKDFQSFPSTSCGSVEIGDIPTFGRPKNTNNNKKGITSAEQRPTSGT